MAVLALVPPGMRKAMWASPVGVLGSRSPRASSQIRTGSFFGIVTEVLTRSVRRSGIALPGSFRTFSGSIWLKAVWSDPKSSMKTTTPASAGTSFA